MGTSLLKYVFLLSFVFINPLFTQDSSSIYDLSFEELMKIKVKTASLSELSLSEVPASVTIITKKEIASTPHRNILDLIDVYVPGAFSMNHGQGPKLGIRGVISSSNVKFLLLINGRNVTERVKNGVLGEIDQWNLQDIEKIEIIRGPGSVIYGPGAIGGVVNIVTKTADTFTGLRGGLSFNPTYQSNGRFLEYGMKDGEFGIYTFMSLQRTRGYEDPDYYVANTKTSNNFIGKSPGDTSEPQSYMEDSLSDAQIKLHLDMSLGSWRLWTRYTRSGQTYDANSRKDYADGMGTSNKTTYQGFVATLSNQHKINKFNTLSTTLSFDSHDYRNYKKNDDQFNEGSFINRKFGYSENELFLQSILNSEITERFKLSLGAEISYEWVRAPWGESEDRLLIDNGGSIISGLGSDYIGDGDDGTIDPSDPSTYFVGNGWEHTMFSLLSEASYEFNSHVKLIGSLRADKHQLADWSFSPRLALISKIDDKNSLKFIAQRSVRMETTPAMVIADKSNGDTKQEEMTGFELIYHRNHTKNLSFTINSFYNQISIMGFNGSSKNTENVGDLETAGLELELKYKNKFLTLGASHSFVKQLNFRLSNNQKDNNGRQGVSYADYNFSKDFITLTDEGNDLNNWANQSTKFFIDYEPNENWILHVDARVYWGMPGAEDELDAYEDAYNRVDVAALSAPDQIDFLDDKAAALAEIDDLRDRDAFGIDFRLNASVTYKFNMKESDMAITLYAQNLLGINGNKKYNYNTGSSKNYPNRASFTEEPFALGLMFTVKF